MATPQINTSRKNYRNPIHGSAKNYISINSFTNINDDLLNEITKVIFNFYGITNLTKQKEK